MSNTTTWKFDNGNEGFFKFFFLKAKIFVNLLIEIDISGIQLALL